MKKEELFKELEGVNNLPTLPPIIQRLTQAVQDPNSDAERVAAIIKDDQSMMARILKIVNSAAYGLPERIHSIQQAIATMGFVAVRNVALSTAVFSAHADSNGFSKKEFWRHAISTGLGVNVLHKSLRHPLDKPFSPDLLHLAGLLHDIGKVVLQQFFQADFADAIVWAEQKWIPLFRAEFEIFGANHAEVGAWLAQKWKLPEDVVQSIRWHHDPENANVANVEIARLCHTANYICNLKKVGNGGDLIAPAFEIGVWRRLGLTVPDIEGIVASIAEESKLSETLLSL
ncbi:MAG: HDOD domain-containing protein [Kiritimatiellae bacterium]|nr:HDOD domain-containing protein [Kiritimatiellia bacterium]